jgi:multidrug efflux pump subunit AcrA (membrane-fusion protein)
MPHREAAPPFLDVDPPPLVVRAAGALLLALFAVALVLAAVLKLPVTVGGHFTLVPVRGADPVRAPRAGIVSEVVSEVTVVEGAVVEEGTPLFRLRSELAGDRAGEVATLELTVRGAEERITNERARTRSQVEADRGELRGLGRQAAALGREIALGEKKTELADKLVEHAHQAFAEGLMAYDEVQAKELEATRAAMEVVRLRSEEDEARAHAERLGHEMEVKARAVEETERALREEVSRARLRLETLRGAPVPSAGDVVTVTARCAGTVVRLHARAPGAVVASGDPLGELVCAGEDLRAEISIDDKGMGVVAPGLPVKLAYDAFPYQRHGVRYATVRWIGPAAEVRPGAPAFRVLAELRDREIGVRGMSHPLLPGMTGTAEIIVARQSALAYVLEPLRALREDLGHAP